MNGTQTASKSHIYRGPTAPITCLALSPSAKTIYAGSWDKIIWSWDVETRTPSRRFQGHNDFVKALLCIRLNGHDILISGAADATIIIWNATTGTKLQVLKGGHTRGIQDLAIDPTTYPPPTSTSTSPDSTSSISTPIPIRFFSASSDRTIRRWNLTLKNSPSTHRPDKNAHPTNKPLENLTLSAQEIDPLNPIIAHETSIYKILFSPSPSDEDTELWTCSADGTIKCLSCAQAFTAETTLPHGDYVRSIALDEEGGTYVISGGRSEDVKVWDRGTGELVHVYEGHFGEIMDLVVLRGRAVSVGIDGTVRTWGLTRRDIERAKVEKDDGVEERVVDKKKEEEQGDLMTEEEERELAELMDD